MCGTESRGLKKNLRDKILKINWGVPLQGNGGRRVLGRNQFQNLMKGEGAVGEDSWALKLMLNTNEKSDKYSNGQNYFTISWPLRSFRYVYSIFLHWTSKNTRNA